MPDRSHGTPYDRGSADRYYGRNFNPHYHAGPLIDSKRIGKDQMTEEELAEYKLGWDEQDDRKDWG